MASYPARGVDVVVDQSSASLSAAAQNAGIQGGSGGAVLAGEDLVTKTQFVSGEDLRVTFPAFVDKTSGLRIIGTDIASLVIKKPDSVLLAGPPTPAWDTDVNFWVATVPLASFIEGEWLIYATSNDPNALPQFKALTWGDYMDDIPETRQAAVGRWQIVGTQLLLYEDDGVTVFKTFDLKDSAGLPSVSEIFERDPV